MENTYFCTPEEFLKNSRIPVRVMESEASMYEEISDIMVDTIVKNNAEGKSTFIICPVGPIAQYPLFVEKVNSRNISLKNVTFLNMDEYLTDDDKMISPESTLSFVGIMNKLVYSKIKPELVMPESQRLFPVPGKEADADALVEKLGGADCILTGVGINGHIAFNEPPAADEKITDEEFGNIGTRCLNTSMATIVNNGAHKVRGALDLMPRRCISLGMKQLLAAKMIKVYLYCDWQWGIMRKGALEPKSRFTPVSYLADHPNAEMVVTKELFNFML